MNSFEIKELWVINDYPGLWRLKGEAGRMVVFYSLVDEARCITVPGAKVKGRIENFEVYTDKGKVRLETVLETMMEIVEKEQLTLPENFRKLSDVEKQQWMSKLVPGYSSEQFKLYHFDQILKWYKEIDKALTILDESIEDPYDENETENNEEIAITTDAEHTDDLPGEPGTK